ncbi:MAG: menaquinone biosynthesis protein [SAR324 cluster bacterium]|nr:menaquinone biosynthesis protein [SAR324 cluster bacterium]
MKAKIKLGIIDYLNVLPVYYGFLKKHFSIEWEAIKGTPTELNQQIAAGQLDIAVISSFEYAQNPDFYYLFPDLSVSANGAVHSIFLFSHIPLEELTGPVGLTRTSATSVHLLKYLLRNHEVTYFFSQDDDKKQTELLIGDEAIRMYYTSQYPYAYDLSLLWNQETQLPFVFAVWVVRREIFEKHPQEVIKIYHYFLQSKQESVLFYDKMAAEFNRGIFPSAHACTDYLKNLRYDLSPSFQAGFLLFQQYCVELGFLKKVAPLQFFPFPVK